MMPPTNLPTRAKPEVLHSVCRLSRGSETVNRGTLYDELDDNRKTIRRTTNYGETLGFLKIEDSEVGLTSRGVGLSYQPKFEGNEAVHELFQEAIEEYEPYRKILQTAHARGVTEEILDDSCITQSTFKDIAEEIMGGEVENRQINVLIKTADAADLGEYRAGKRGYETRLIISNTFDEYLDKLSVDYPVEEGREEEETETEREIEESAEVETIPEIEAEISTEGRGEGLKLEIQELKIQINLGDKSEKEIREILDRAESIA